MSPSLRKLVLTTHVVCSVGWLGAVLVFLVLAVLGLSHGDAFVVRASYVAMERIGWLAIVPLCFGSLATGIVQGLRTPWGLFRHYWVLIKLAITIVASALLLLHMHPVGRLSRAAIDDSIGHGERAMQVQILADAALALIALVAATTLSVYKPRGVTAYGRRRLGDQ
jgi:hypothetical protein